MKKITLLFIPVLLLSIFSCGGKTPDNKKSTKEKSDSLFAEMDSLKQKKTDKEKEETNDSLSTDEKFFFNAFHSSRFEVMLGELALKKGTVKIKKIAEMIIKDHQLMMDELEQIGKSKHLKIPRILDNKHQNKYSDIAKLDSVKFDKKYAETMVKGHEENIKMFEDEMAAGEDKDFTKFASVKLATLEEHLHMAKSVDANVKK